LAPPQQLQRFPSTGGLTGRRDITTRDLIADMGWEPALPHRTSRVRIAYF